MRTTIRLNDQLLGEVKQRAARSGSTITSIIEEALRKFLSAEGERPRSARVKLPTYRGKGLHAGVDLDDSASLRDLMDKGA